jgi:MOSC domain-containing protein YiiM
VSSAVTLLQPTKIRGRVEAVLTNPDRSRGLEKQRRERVQVSFAGFDGDCHAGLTRPADVRVRKQYAKNTPIRNTRQVSILSSEELAEIADAMELPEVRPEWVGANLVLSGIPQLTRLPGSTRLIFSGGAALVVDTENAPCRYPAEVIESHHAGYGTKFIDAARHRRGVTGWVEREGLIAIGDGVEVHLPPQRIYAPAKA